MLALNNKKNTINFHLLSIYLSLASFFLLPVFSLASDEPRAIRQVNTSDSTLSPSAGNILADVRVKPSELSVTLGARRDDLTLGELIEIAFHFSGTSTSDMPAYEGKLNALIDQLAGSLAAAEKNKELNKETSGTAASPEVTKGEAVLLFMHKQILKRYSEQQSKLDVELDTGQYNCVSSATLYLILARAVGLRVGGVKTSDHAFCILYTDQGNYDVETTNIYGFDPGKKKEFKNEFGKVTGFSYVPPHNYNSRTLIGANALVGLIVQNRISVLTENHSFAEAAGLAVDAYAFLDNADAFEKMILTFTNIGSWANINQYFTEGIDFINLVTEIYGPHEKLLKTKKDLVHNWIVELLGKHDFTNAGKVIEERYKMGDLPVAEYQEFIVYIDQINAQEIEQSKGPLAAFRYVEQRLHSVENNSTLINMKKIYLHNYEVQVHNSMAAAYNAGHYEQAKSIVEEALALLPDSQKLKQDLAVVIKALAKD